jgi:uncharacterized low-complexity protein
MNPTKKIAIAAAFTGLLALANAGAAQADEASSALTMKPLHGVSFDVGAERAVSYFVSENSQCKLVVTLAGAPNWDDKGSFTATRFEAAILAGKATRYLSSEGKAFEFACAADAQAMNVKQVEQVAAATGQ